MRAMGLPVFDPYVVIKTTYFYSIYKYNNEIKNWPLAGSICVTIASKSKY